MVAKMLAGEASSQELDELGQLLRTNPDLHYPLQIITGLWRGSGPEEQKKAEEAFSRHLDRMAALQIEYGDESSKSDESDKSDKNGKIGKNGQSDENGKNRENDENGRTHKNRRRLKILRIAAGCAAAAIAVTVGFLNYRPSQAPTTKTSPAPIPQLSEVITREGSRTNVYLPDGTRVWLNAASKITYARDFGGERTASREVTLSGEAFFDVTHNSAKPFVIHTTRIDIKVLGTSFNVKSYPKEKTTEAVLVKGSIEVEIHNKANKKVILKPNEKLIVDNVDSITLQPHRTLRPATNLMEVTILKPSYEPTTGAMIETSWIDNKLIFRDETFDDLARKMQRWYGITIRFAKPELEQLQFTGSFQQETIKQALDALKLTANFNYSIQEKQIDIY